MKISELSNRSSVSVPTIKFYIREGLLPPGTRTSRNQADYGPPHLARLALIRSLRDDAGLPLEMIARALRAADETGQDFVVAAIDALERPAGVSVETDSEEYKQALDAIVGLALARGWEVSSRDVSVRNAARALAIVMRSFSTQDAEALTRYFDVAEQIAACEIPDDWAPEASRDDALAYAVLGTVLFEPLILALRRMAHVARTRALRDKARSPASS